jgi:hypothetical protein
MGRVLSVRIENDGYRKMNEVAFAAACVKNPARI